jgi:hypothetical protein
LKIGIPSGNPVPIDRIVFASRNYFHFHLALGCVQRLMAARTSLPVVEVNKVDQSISYGPCMYNVLTRCLHVHM